MSARLILVLISLFALPLVACSTSADIGFRSDDQWNYLSLTMTEAQIQEVLVPILENGREFRVQSPVIDLRPGSIAVSGSVIGDGGRLYPGNMSVRAWAADGRLHVEVTQFDFAGFNATPSMLQQFNADIEAGLERDASRRDSETHEVVIDDSSLSITWRSPR